MRKSLSLITASLIATLMISAVYAVTYPTGTPTGETTGGAFNTYFTNMFSTPCSGGQVVAGFTSTGILLCTTPTGGTSTDTLGLSGALIGTVNYLAKYTPTGTGINNSQVYDNGTNVGIGTASPTSLLSVRKDQIGFTNMDLVNSSAGLSNGAGLAIGQNLANEQVIQLQYHNTLNGIWGSDVGLLRTGGNANGGLVLAVGSSTAPMLFYTANTEKMRLISSGNLGIGTTTPGAKLEVAGQIKITGGGVASGSVLTSDATGLASWSPSAPLPTTPALVSALSGSFWSLTGNTIGASNYIGSTNSQDLVFKRNNIEGMRLSGASGNLVTTADARINGVTVGRGGGNIATNTANGNGALVSNTTGFWNTANGSSALSSNTTGLANTANGYRALIVNTTGTSNTANGFYTLQANTTGGQNTANGANALNDNTTGGNNTANGGSALQFNITGGNNTANGGFSLYANTLGSNNVGVGFWALFNNTTGNNNTTLGNSAGSAITTGSSNIAIGDGAQVASPTASNQLNIGNWIYGTSGNIGIGTGTALTAKLTVAGTVQIATAGAYLDYRPNAVACTSSQVLAWSGAVTGWVCSNDSVGISGSGLITNYVTKWNGTAIANSQIFDTGTGVGIGVTTPSEKLEVSGNIKATSFLTSSDERLKTGFHILDGALSRILSLHGYSFLWKSDGRSDIGIIAQEVERVFPDLVHTDPTTGYKSVEYPNLIAPMIEAIREQQAIIDRQQSHIDDLETRLRRIETSLAR